MQFARDTGAHHELVLDTSTPAKTLYEQIACSTRPFLVSSGTLRKRESFFISFILKSTLTNLVQ